LMGLGQGREQAAVCRQCDSRAAVSCTRPPPPPRQVRKWRRSLHQYDNQPEGCRPPAQLEPQFEDQQQPAQQQRSQQPPAPEQQPHSRQRHQDGRRYGQQRHHQAGGGGGGRHGGGGQQSRGDGHRPAGQKLTPSKRHQSSDGGNAVRAVCRVVVEIPQAIDMLAGGATCEVLSPLFRKPLAQQVSRNGQRQAGSGGSAWQSDAPSKRSRPSGAQQQYPAPQARGPHQAAEQPAAKPAAAAPPRKNWADQVDDAFGQWTN
jgi:hypothetical protein